MADLESTAKPGEEADSFEKFAQEFHETRGQQNRPAEEDPPVEPTPAEPVSEEGEQAETPPAEVDAQGSETVEATEETPPDESDDSKVPKYLVPDHESFGELRGKRATAAELEEAGLLNKMFTRVHQEMHHTKLYQDLKKKFDEDLEQKLREAGIGQPKEQPPAKVDPKEFGDQIERTFRPHLEALAKAGSFEPDFVEAYPRLASQLAHQFESFRLIGSGLVKAVQEIKNHVDGQVSRDSKNEHLSYLENSMVGIASDDEMYSALNESSERKLFLEWMRSPDNDQPWKKLDIVEQLSKPDVLRGAYAAFRTATRHLRETPPPSTSSNVRERAALAAAGGGTQRQATKAPQLDEFAQMKQDLERARAQRFGR